MLYVFVSISWTWIWTYTGVVVIEAISSLSCDGKRGVYALVHVLRDTYINKRTLIK